MKIIQVYSNRLFQQPNFVQFDYPKTGLNHHHKLFSGFKAPHRRLRFGMKDPPKRGTSLGTTRD